MGVVVMKLWSILGARRVEGFGFLLGQFGQEFVYFCEFGVDLVGDVSQFPFIGILKHLNSLYSSLICEFCTVLLW